MEKIICPTGYYGIYDSLTNRFILGIQQPSPTKARHKLKCRLSHGLIDRDFWSVQPIFENHKSHFNFPLRWKGTHIRYKQNIEKGWYKDVNQLVQQVELWSSNKGLHKSSSAKQFLKVVEEVGEVAAALARNDKAALRDGIGDVVVTLIILAQQNNMTLHECLEFAYDEIKGRTGQMVNGVFVKSEDLKQSSDVK